MAAENRDTEARLRQLMTEIEQGGAKLPHHPRAAATPQAAPQTSSSKGPLQRLRSNFLLPLGILALPWMQEIVDQVLFRGGWNLPLHPRSLEGIPGIFLSAFSHAGFTHLIGNSIAFAIFSWLILAKSRHDYWITFLVGWLGGGLASWLLGPTSVHGLSGVVYTLFGYLLVIGWLEKRFVPLLISVFVLINYSAAIWGIFPTHPQVAWWGHLLGFLLGILAAYGVYREPNQSSPTT